MTNLDRFNEAFAHMTHRCMGRRLARFTLRHRFWLEALSSPLVTGGAVSLLDLALAARVCAMPCKQLDRRLPALLERGPTLWERLGYLARVWRRRVEVEYRDFQAYMIDHGCPPDTFGHDGVVHAPDGAAQEGALPGVLGLVTGLMRGTGWTPDTVWALSVGEAEWYLAGVFLHRGVDVGLKTGMDERMEEMLRKRKQREEELSVVSCL